MRTKMTVVATELAYCGVQVITQVWHDHDDPQVVDSLTYTVPEIKSAPRVGDTIHVVVSHEQS